LQFLVSLLPFIGLGCFISGVGQMLDALFPILAVEYGGMNEAQVGILFMVSTAVVLVAGPLFGWLSDHISRKLVMLMAGIASALASALYLVFPSLMGISGGKVVDDVGKAAFRPAWGAVMGQISTMNRGRRGQAVGYRGMGKDAGEIAGPILASLLWTIWGIPVVLGVRIALAIGAEIYSLTILRRLKKLEGRQPPPPLEAVRRNASELGV
jgi:MFS family permease